MNVDYLFTEAARRSARRSRSSSRTASGCRSSSRSPGLLYAVRAPWRQSRTWWLAGAALLVLIPTLLYYGGGWLQFGYRYALDSIPFVWALCALAAAKRRADPRDGRADRRGDRARLAAADRVRRASSGSAACTGPTTCDRRRSGAARVRRIVPILLATWFVAISAMRLILIFPGGPGFDGRLYRSATVAWLAGEDPWSVVQGGVWFGAPPPSLIPMIPFALLPETLGVGLLLVLCVAGSVWAIRELELPLWWLAFPPLVDGVWNANPHALVLPLLLASLAPIAIIVKIYAAIVPAVRARDPDADPRRHRDRRHRAVPALVDVHRRATGHPGSPRRDGGRRLQRLGPADAAAGRRARRRRRRVRRPRPARSGPGRLAGDAGVLAVDAVVLLVDRDPGRLRDRRGSSGGMATMLTLAVAAAVLASPVEGAPVVALAVVAAVRPLWPRSADRARSEPTPAAADPPIAGLP